MKDVHNTCVTGFSPGLQTTLCRGRLRPTQLTQTNSRRLAYMKHIHTPSQTFMAVRLETTGNVERKPLDVVKKLSMVVTPVQDNHSVENLFIPQFRMLMMSYYVLSHLLNKTANLTGKCIHYIFKCLFSVESIVIILELKIVWIHPMVKPSDSTVAIKVI